LVFIESVADSDIDRHLDPIFREDFHSITALSIAFAFGRTHRIALGPNRNLNHTNGKRPNEMRTRLIGLSGRCAPLLLDADLPLWNLIVTHQTANEGENDEKGNADKPDLREESIHEEASISAWA